MEQLNENLLGAWIKLSTSIINPRMVSELSYNESLVCHVLYANLLRDPEKKLTATDLCAETNMAKSLMNRTLNHLEDKKMILRERSQEDRRQVHVTLRPENCGVFLRQHQRLLQLVDAIIATLGEDEAQRTAGLLADIAAITERLASEMNEVKK